MTAVLAHVGGRTDLPVPLSFFVVGAGVAVVISFVMVSANWLEPRLQGTPEQEESSGRAVDLAGRGLGWVGAAGLLLVLANGALDGTATTNAISPVLVWIIFWLVIPFGSAALGGIWRWMNPYRRLVHSVARRRPERKRRGLQIGVWPAVVAFVGFTWLELVYPDNTLPGTLATAAIGYAAYMLALALWLGPETALRSGAAFEIYTDTISHIAPREFSDAPDIGPAQLVKRGWVRALPHMNVPRGMTAFVAAMIGTVSYDGLSGADWWRDLVGDLRRDSWFESVALLGTVVVIWALFYGASVAAKRLASSSRRAIDIARSFTHTLVPIALAYAFAHYFTLIVFEGQQLVHAASDPFGRGWDLFGTADWRVQFTSSTLWVWYVQVAVIVAGHIAGVVLAHDRALADFGPEVAVRTQYAMLVLMVALTSIGLFILAG